MSNIISSVSSKIKELRDISNLSECEAMPSFIKGSFVFELIINRDQLSVEIDSEKTGRWGTLFSSKTRLDQPHRMEEMAALYGFDNQDDAMLVKQALVDIEEHLDRRIAVNKNQVSDFMSVFK